MLLFHMETLAIFLLPLGLYLTDLLDSYAALCSRLSGVIITVPSLPWLSIPLFYVIWVGYSWWDDWQCQGENSEMKPLWHGKRYVAGTLFLLGVLGYGGLWACGFCQNLPSA